MKDRLFLIPLVIGFGIMAVGYKFQIAKGPAMNRPSLGLALVIGSIFWWWSSAILLVREGKFYFIFNMLTVLAFFTGLAFFFPAPPDAKRTNQHSLPAIILVWAGTVLGLTHSLALMFSAGWPALLLRAYAALGLHGAPSSTL